MITALYIVSAMFALYGVVWLVMLASHRRGIRKSVAVFMDAWQRDDYATIARADWSSEPSYLRISYPYGLSHKYFDVDQDGHLISGIKWKDNDRTRTHVDRYLRQLIEPITQQIATMARLEGKFDDVNDGGNVGSAP